MYAAFLSDDEIRALPRLPRRVPLPRLQRWTLFAYDSRRTANPWNTGRLWYGKSDAPTIVHDTRGLFLQPTATRTASRIRSNPGVLNELFNPHHSNGRDPLWLLRRYPQPEAHWYSTRAPVDLIPLLDCVGWNPVALLQPLQGRGASILRTFVIRAFQARQRETLTFDELL